MYTVYDRIFGDVPAKKTVYTPCMYMILANPIRIICITPTLEQI